MQEDSIKVSIILPTYNGAKYIRESIDSCLNQTYENIELIIVDDGSVDETSEIIKSYKDKRIKYIRHKQNRGISHALNTGFKNATGEYLTWSSDDNFYASEAIECMVNALNKHDKIHFIYTNFYKIDEEKYITGRRKVGSVKKLNRKNCIGPCFLYRRKVYEEIGDYSQKAFLAEDYEYWLRIRKRFYMKKLNKFLYYYRVHTDSLSSLYTEKTEMLKEKIIYKYSKLGKATKYYLLKSLFHNPLIFDLQDYRMLIISILDHKMKEIIIKKLNLIKEHSRKC